MEKYVADLNLLSKELTSDAWISSLDEKLKDSTEQSERPRIIKVFLSILFMNFSSSSMLKTT